MNSPPPEHRPVLVEQVVTLLAPQPGEVILDGTIGLGGHALALLPLIMPGGRYIGLDRDETMLAAARARIASRFPSGVDLVQGNFAELPRWLAELGVRQVDRMLLDLGVNSAQLDDPLRGFSFEQDGPLDMRFDRNQARKAVDLVNGLSESELADLFYFNAQEGLSRKIARRICQVRHGGRISSTLALARVVESVYGALEAGGKTHAATRVFQALRIAVNAELDSLREFLRVALDYLRPGGRLAIISFHSLEDGLVKEAFRAGRAAGRLIEVTRRPVIADPAERGANPRSRSAKMRVAERTDS